LRADRGVTLKRLAEALQVSAAYLSALEHGKRGAPSTGLVHQVNEFFGLIWDEADDLAYLARLSNPRVTVNTAGLTPEQTALANRVAQLIHCLSPRTVAALHAELDAAARQQTSRPRRTAATRPRPAGATGPRPEGATGPRPEGATRPRPAGATRAGR
jgi:transcriptional regulator with XRE-family HTH domain